MAGGALLATTLALVPAEGTASEFHSPYVTRLTKPSPPDALVAVINTSAPLTDVSASQFCSGVLVTPKVVLTAGHCVRAKEASQVSVIISARNLCSTRPITGHRLRVSAIYLFPLNRGDGALLLLTSDAPAGAVASIASRRVRAETLVVAWGWGTDAVGGGAPCRPQRKVLRVAPLAKCAEILAQTFPDAASRFFCAIPRADSRNTCEGDSGGPVFTTTATPRLVGLTVAGLGCGQSDPGTYLDLTSNTCPILCAGELPPSPRTSLRPTRSQ